MEFPFDITEADCLHICELARLFLRMKRGAIIGCVTGGAVLFEWRNPLRIPDCLAVT